MTVYDDCFNLHDFDPGDLGLHGSNEFSESQLCVPPDKLEDLKWEWFPFFSDELVASNQSSFSGASDQPRTHERQGKTKRRKSGTVNGNWVEICDGAVYGYTKRKARTKKEKEARRSMVVIGRKKCSHCKTEETPQWRKLCNACGVRFKSGRLLPEYRPAASPTFDEWRHSNYHRKILQKRGSDC